MGHECSATARARERESSARLLAADGGGLLAADGGGRGGGVPPVHTEISVRQSRESSAKKFRRTSSVRRRCKESGEGDRAEQPRDAQGEVVPRCTERRNREWFLGFCWKEHEMVFSQEVVTLGHDFLLACFVFTLNMTWR
ncbi:hypothetical protein Scep_011942 [Stephania cephalantha]|uniref:Uncharacterized protein n=1 Tax=Stephania cephalantha TaxID=152367 RepID=A0AAP0P704_9MAGN